MKILEHVPLAQYTTFKIGGPARFFCAVRSDAELLEAVTFAQNKKIPIFILGGGSNLLSADSGFSGLVIKIELKGVSFNGELVTAQAGEMWDEIVLTTLEKKLYGLENLSAIPGLVGAAAVQNIGAYGVEVSSVIETVRVFDVANSTFENLTNKQCAFSYRDSVFKRRKGAYVITAVTFKLSKNEQVNIEYRDLKEYFARSVRSDLGDEGEVRPPQPRKVREAVIEIRWNKLPDWKLWGTAGSFFKNPIIPLQQFIDLKQRYPDLPGFPESDSRIKVSLGWILDKVCHFRGLCIGNVCVYEKQALVLVAQPGATAEEVIAVSKKMSAAVKEKTNIEVEAEVEWVN